MISYGNTKVSESVQNLITIAHTLIVGSYSTIIVASAGSGQHTNQMNGVQKTDRTQQETGMCVKYIISLNYLSD